MKKIFIATMVVGGLFVTSCTQDIYDVPVTEEYSKNFMEEFGVIDENQDWNMASQKSVTVVGAEAEVLVYAQNNNGVFKLAGQYQNVSDGQKLTFDAIKKANNFIVSTANRGMIVQNGGVADFTASTRTLFEPVENVFTTNEEYTEFTYDEVMSFATMVPEDVRNLGKDGLTNDFSVMKDDRTITVYPVYWHADFNHILGIYWFDEGGNKHTQEIYRSKQGNDVQINVGGQWINANQKLSTQDANGTTCTAIRSRGFNITLPAGTQYGFYDRCV